MDPNAIRTYKDKTLKTTSQVVMEACQKLLKDSTGLSPYPEQCKGARLIYDGNIVEMKTGEGKTITILLAAMLVAREGRKVYIVTSNDYLSERDYNFSREIFEALGLQSVFFKSGIGGNAMAYKKADIIYATGETLIFDYLRGIPADYDFTIIDEIDYILVECANHDFSVSTGEHLVEMPKSVFHICKRLADFLSVKERKTYTPKEDYLFDYQYEAEVVIDSTKRQAEITEKGFERLRSIFGEEPDLLFMEVLHASLLAKYFYLRDVHYIVSDEKIIIINDSSGRISIGGSNDIVIQSAIEEKEGIPITPKALLHNTCSFPVFFSQFRTLTGLSGTASLVPYDFDIIFEKNVEKVPEHLPNQRKEIYEYFASDSVRKQYIRKLIAEQKGPFLVVTDSDQRSLEMEELLQKVDGRNVMLLDNRHLDEETDLLAQMKEENAVLISGKIVGRGTDIDLPQRFEDGLTVILTTRFLSERAERQVIGRTGRNGKKGTCYILTAKDDRIFDYAFQDKKLPNERYIKKLQKNYEQKQFDIRKHIYIRSKLFFDQDRAVKERIEALQSFEECRDFLMKAGADEKLLQLSEKIIENQVPFLPSHRAILLSYYDRIRPFYQQQFLRYSDLMASTLYNTDGFAQRGKEFVKSSKEVICEVIGRLLASIQRNM